MWFKKKCQIHDLEIVNVAMDYDIIRKLEREGCPIIMDRVVIGLDISGEAIVSETELNIQIGDHVLEQHWNHYYSDNVCLRCGRAKAGVKDAEKQWKEYIKEYGGGYRVKRDKQMERKSKARKLWEDKYGISE